MGDSPRQFSKMPGGDKKLETADELWDLYNDLERLKDYRYSQPIVSDSGINNEKFHLDLPYEEIKKIVEDCRDKFMAKCSRRGEGWPQMGARGVHLYQGDARVNDAGCSPDPAPVSSNQGGHPSFPGQRILFQLLLPARPEGSLVVFC